MTTKYFIKEYVTFKLIQRNKVELREKNKKSIQKKAREEKKINNNKKKQNTQEAQNDC